ncbi:MAG: hypothetical protein JXD18_03180 [Anaerolineae bacterium]|nr:hypothetical protein [Anaerolineae bacterium]
MKDRVRIALGIVLILLGIALVAQRMGWFGRWEVPVWAFVLVAIGLAALGLAISSKEFWWALIPACLFITMGVFMYVTENGLLQEDAATGGSVFFGMALPFWLILIIRGRSFWWAAIPAAVLTFVALSAGLTAVIGEVWTGSLVMWGIAIPFWIVYATNRERWWAIIPAGVMTTLGVIPLVEDAWPGVWIAGFILGGLALTFLLIYVLSGLRRELAWALWPAVGCLIGAVSIPLLQERANLVPAVILIIVGLIILSVTLFRRKS